MEAFDVQVRSGWTWQPSLLYSFLVGIGHETGRFGLNIVDQVHSVINGYHTSVQRSWIGRFIPDQFHLCCCFVALCFTTFVLFYMSLFSPLLAESALEVGFALFHCWRAWLGSFAVLSGVMLPKDPLSRNSSQKMVQGAPSWRSQVQTGIDTFRL